MRLARCFEAVALTAPGWYSIADLLIARCFINIEVAQTKSSKDLAEHVWLNMEPVEFRRKVLQVCELEKSLGSQTPIQGLQPWLAFAKHDRNVVILA